MQFASSMRANNPPVVSDIEQLSAADPQPNGEHHDCNEEVEQ
jgi:hypothetical protein